eukprot:1777955-Amphidinium_carterae.1
MSGAKIGLDDVDRAQNYVTWPTDLPSCLLVWICSIYGPPDGSAYYTNSSTACCSVEPIQESLVRKCLMALVPSVTVATQLDQKRDVKQGAREPQ